MARVKKKVKKEKQEGSSSKLGLIIGVVAGVLAFACVVGFLTVYLMENITTKLYKNSRDMDYDTLVEILDDSTERQKYEGTMYILVFHSDYETYDDYSLSDNANTRIKTAIKNDLSLNELYDANKVEQQNRIAFYAIDLMDDSNADIVNHDKLGHTSGKPYIIKITNYTSNTITKTTSIAAYVQDTISASLESEIAKFK